jgi:hypothetical protein
MHGSADRSVSRAHTASRIAFAVFAGIALFFLLTEHRAHVFGALPYLLVLACPLMHLFHHHGHRHDDERPDAHRHDEPGAAPEGRSK